MSKLKKILRPTLYILFCLLVFGGTWYLAGMPYGKIPGHFNRQDSSYQVSILGQSIKGGFVGDKYIRVAIKYPFYKEGVIDTLGNIIIPLRYEKYISTDKYNDLLYVKRNGKMGISSFDGKIQVPLQYLEMWRLPAEINKDLFVAMDVNWNLGVVDIKGKVIIPFVYKAYYRTAEYLLFSKQNIKGWTFFGDNFSSNLHLYNLDWQPVVYNYKGEKLIENTEYTFINPTNETIPLLFANTKNNKTYIIDKKTFEVIDSIDYITLGVRKLNTNLCEISGIIYKPKAKEKALKYSFEKNALVDDKDSVQYTPKLGLYSLKKHKMKIMPRLDIVRSLSNGNLFICSSDSCGIIDSTATHWVAPIHNSKMHVYKHIPLIKVMHNESHHKDKRVYYIDFQMKMVLPLSAESIVIVDEQKSPRIHFREGNHDYVITYNSDSKEFEKNK